MRYHNTYRKWFAITNQQLKNMAAKYFDPFRRRSLEGDYDQIYTLGPNQWLGINTFDIPKVMLIFKKF